MDKTTKINISIDINDKKLYNLSKQLSFIGEINTIPAFIIDKKILKNKILKLKILCSNDLVKDFE